MFEFLAPLAKVIQDPDQGHARGVEGQGHAVEGQGAGRRKEVEEKVEAGRF